MRIRNLVSSLVITAITLSISSKPTYSICAEPSVPSSIVGIWRSGTYANYSSFDLDRDDFIKLANERRRKGLRLVDIETYKHAGSGRRYWAGEWSRGSASQYFNFNLSRQEFINLNAQLQQEGLRLVDVEIYSNNGVDLLWLGLWRSGSYTNLVSGGLDLESFIALANRRHKQGLRLIDIETYYDNTKGRKWVGVWQSGTDANYFMVGLNWASFVQLVNERHNKRLRLIDVETYSDRSGNRVWAGVWRSGTDANYISRRQSLGNFIQLANERHSRRLRLVDIEIYKPTLAGEIGNISSCDDQELRPVNR